MYTVEWLYNRGMIQWVDMIHFTDLGEKKYFLDRFNEKEVYFLEDNIYNLVDIEERPNVCNIFVRNELNRLVDLSFYEAEKYVGVNNLKEAIDFIKNATSCDI